MAIPVNLEAYQGPLDVLLNLIEKNKIDIYDIPIAMITDQYLDYVRAMDKEDMDITSEFMVMAATLIDIKCRMLLPKEVDEEGEEVDPREELVRQLLEYKEYKEISRQLREYLENAGDVVTRKTQLPPEVVKYRPEVKIEDLLKNVTLERLHEIYEFVLKRQEDKIDPIRSKFGHIERDEVSLADKLDFVEIMVRKKRKVSFRSLLKEQHSKMQVVVTFLAVLELMKLGKVHCEQDAVFGDIEIESLEDEHDTSLVSDAYREGAGGENAENYG
ncbi:MAG: segregation/condensation protein A [Eubacteriales bacterium]|nr:segregation/condensation protein A [Eubacteriales bacterium]